jgi:hypothetical protein
VKAQVEVRTELEEGFSSGGSVCSEAGAELSAGNLGGRCGFSWLLPVDCKGERDKQRAEQDLRIWETQPVPLAKAANIKESLHKVWQKTLSMWRPEGRKSKGGVTRDTWARATLPSQT